MFRKGEPGDKFYLIKEGTALVMAGQEVLAKLGPGKHFGERALMGAEVGPESTLGRGH